MMPRGSPEFSASKNHVRFSRNLTSANDHEINGHRDAGLTALASRYHRSVAQDLVTKNGYRFRSDGNLVSRP